MKAILIALFGAAAAMAASTTGASAQVLESFRSIRMRPGMHRRAAGAGLHNASRLAAEHRQRSRPSVTRLDRLSGSFLGGSLERRRVLFARRHDHSVRPRHSVAAYRRTAIAAAAKAVPGLSPALLSAACKRLTANREFTTENQVAPAAVASVEAAFLAIGSPSLKSAAQFSPAERPARRHKI